MTPKLIGLTLALALVATVTFASPAGEDAGAATEREMVMDPSTGEMISAPEYGGTFTYALKEEPGGIDAVLAGGWGSIIYNLVLENLTIQDWSTPRDEHDFAVALPPTHTIGLLAESWSQPDPLTYVFNIRQGVRWQDKAPVNGRLFTAEDVEFNFHRLFGIGSGYTERSEFINAGEYTGVELESVTATDSSTVVIKLPAPNSGALVAIIQGGMNIVYAPEVIRAKGNASDWRDLVGTGPYTLTDWTKGSSVTYDKNPDYWRFDEKFPENRLPYFDQIRALVMPEVATYVSALRSGQLDYIGAAGGTTELRGVDQLESLQRTNPELKVYPFALRSDQDVGMNIKVKPFDDIRVRKAMQMALNLDEIDQGYYKGLADAIPQGQISRFNTAVATPFEDWPADVRKAFEYDPAGAEALLDEAGYPRGADGVRFETEIVHQPRYDLNYTELLISYWDAIGVKAEVVILPLAEHVAARTEGNYELITAEGAYKGSAAAILGKFLSTSWNTSEVDDEWYRAKFEEYQAATTLDEQNGALRELEMYSIEQFWQLAGAVGPAFSVTQPWVAGYNGESTLTRSGQYLAFARLWFDSSLKP